MQLIYLYDFFKNIFIQFKNLACLKNIHKLILNFYLLCFYFLSKLGKDDIMVIF
jgi:hypothetical protein